MRESGSESAGLLFLLLAPAELMMTKKTSVCGCSSTLARSGFTAVVGGAVL